MSWKFAPGECPHPGETLRELLDERTDLRPNYLLAHRLGISHKHLSEILNGHTLYSADLALRFAGISGTSARFWMHLRADYELNQAEAARGGQAVSLHERVHDCECIRHHDPITILGHSVRCVECGHSMSRNTHAVHLRTGWAHRFASACLPKQDG